MNSVHAKSSWEQIYDLVLSCSRADNHKEFARAFVNSVGEIFPFDQSITFFLDSNGKLDDYYLYNFKQYYADMYVNYYMTSSDIDEKYSVGIIRKLDNGYGISTTSWVDEGKNEFTDNYVGEMKLKYTLGFDFCDRNDSIRTMICLDRIYNRPFSEYELNCLEKAAPLLTQYHKNFFVKPSDTGCFTKEIKLAESLTPRESEIVAMLCQGISPVNIGRVLFISDATVRKHIANIYSKLHVSSQRELFALVISRD